MVSELDCDLIWHIDRAEFRFENPEDYASWKQDRRVYFSLNPPFSADGGAAVFADAQGVAGYYEITEDRGCLLITLEGDGPVITAWVKVRADLVTGLDHDALSRWSSELDGWSSSIIDLGQYEAELHWDDGGDWRLPSDA